MRTHVILYTELLKLGTSTSSLNIQTHIPCYTAAGEDDQPFIAAFVRFFLPLLRERRGLEIPGAMWELSEGLQFNERLPRGCDEVTREISDRWYLDQLRGERDHGLHFYGRGLQLNTFVLAEHPAVEVACVAVRARGLLLGFGLRRAAAASASRAYCHRTLRAAR